MIKLRVIAIFQPNLTTLFTGESIREIGCHPILDYIYNPSHTQNPQYGENGEFVLKPIFTSNE